jgi:hypothetical protein
MCRLSRIGSVPWKVGHREQIILLEDEADLIAGKEVSLYLGFQVHSKQIKLAKLRKSNIPPQDVLKIIIARAGQIRSYWERNEKVPTFKEFIVKRNKKIIEKVKGKSGE